MTAEIVSRIGGIKELDAAVFVPSLQQEADLGFDAEIPAKWVTLYLQYKVARRLVSHRAKEACRMGVPHYRFDVKTDLTANNRCQHNVLCQLQEQWSGGMEFVYYVAPVFHSTEDLTRYLLAATLAENSVFVPPSQLGPVQPGSTHRFAYTTQADVTAFSTPGEPRNRSFPALLEGLQSGDPSERQTLRAHVSRSLDRLSEAFAPLEASPTSRPQVRAPSDLRRLAALFDLEVMLIRLA